MTLHPRSARTSASPSARRPRRTRATPPSCSPAGVERCAKKLGEEAVEVVIAAVTQRQGRARSARRPTCSITCSCCCTPPTCALDDVMAELERRTAQSGSHEKASREGAAPDGQRRSRSRAVPPFHQGRVERASRRRADDADGRRTSSGCASLNDPISFEEAEEIYLPLTRLISFYVEAVAGAASRLDAGSSAPTDDKVPFIIGVAGSVAVGKSTTSRILRGAAAALAELAQGRSRDHRRLPLSRTPCSKSAASWTARASRKATTAARFVSFLSDIKSGKPRRQGAGLFAPRLRRDRRARSSPSTGPTSSSSRGSTSCSRASCRRPASRSSSPPISSISRSSSMPTRTTSPPGSWSASGGCARPPSPTRKSPSSTASAR